MHDENYCVASCEICQQHIEFPRSGLGVKVACPHCGQPTVLLEDLSVVLAPAVGEEISAAELQTAFSGVLPRRRIPFFYQVGLVLVAVFMVLLPLAYLAFAAATACGVYWYARHGLALFSGLAGGIYLLLTKIVLYLGPLVAGVVAVFFMFKPLLARSPKRVHPIELDPSRHPRVYQFIAQICDLLHVSMPRRIDLDANLNASAGFRRGWQSLFGRDLVITLGLPLVAGLNTRQFAALVAHELGHCTQGFAMRLSFLIESINRWFLRVVYQRDTWDEALEEWSNEAEEWPVGFIVTCAQFAVWLSRRLLALLMFAGHAAMCFMSRQMEYHADACASAVAGVAGLESLLMRLRELSLLHDMAYGGLVQSWRQRHLLPDSLPEFLEQLETRMPADFREQASRTLLNEAAGVFATHPTAAQRIRRARQRSEPGLFDLERPARALFTNFGGISKILTSCHYRQNLRLAVTPPMLKPAAEFFADGQAAS